MPTHRTARSPARPHRDGRGAASSKITRRGTLPILAAAIILSLAQVDAKGCRRDRPIERERGGNAFWLERSWLEPGREDAELERLMAQFRAGEIRYLFVHLCPMDPAGRTPAFSEDGLRRLSTLAGHNQPPALVIPWIGGVVGKSTDLADPTQTSGFVAEAARLTRELGCPGVHLNLEPIKSGDPTFLNLLERLGAAIGPERFLSVAAYPPADESFSSRGLVWSPAYFREVARRVDQLVVMSYDTGATAPHEYTGWVTAWTGFAHAIAREVGGVGVLMGAPTYDDPTPLHRPGVETLRAALAGVTMGRSLLRKDPGLLEGVAIYSYRTTGPEEWRQFVEGWVDPMTSRPDRERGDER